MSSSGNTERSDLGAYYALNDLAGLARRSAVLAIDLALVFFICGPIVARGPDLGLSQRAANLVAFCLAWVYLAGFKTGTRGTLGYRAARVQLVDLQGNPARLGLSTARFLFLFGGPLNVFFDLFWLTTDPNRQTLRDKLTGTYVIRRGAQPVGRGPIAYPTYFIASMSFTMPEVLRERADSARPPGTTVEVKAAPADDRSA
jgi:uncharacterized RDD family membrane protein YckC